MIDTLHKYLIAHDCVRAEIVHIRHCWRAIQEGHHYPPAVSTLLGELVAASTLLSANVKFEGSVVLQLQGDGPVQLMLVECQANLGIRAMVKLRAGVPIPDQGDLTTLLNSNGKGRFSLILDPQRRTPGLSFYQGIVPITGKTVAEALTAYMAQSEQLETTFWLAANRECAAGLMLQKLPLEGGNLQSLSLEDQTEAWNRSNVLARTLKAEELLNNTAEVLMHRLYWQENLRAFTPLAIHYYCSCNRERVAAVIQMLGKNEINSILSEQGRVSISCDYCVKEYIFDAIDCTALFSGSNSQLHQGNSTTH